MTDVEPLHNPATGETYGVMGAALRSGGRWFGFERTHQPGRRVPEHIHPYQEERFVVLDGEVTFSIDGRTVVAGPGDLVSVPAGVRHAPLNRTGAANRAIVSFRPGLDSKRFFEAIAGQARHHRTFFAGVPVNPLRAAGLGRRFRDEFELSAVPRPLRRLTYATLGLLATGLGVRPWQPAWQAAVRPEETPPGAGAGGAAAGGARGVGAGGAGGADGAAAAVDAGRHGPAEGSGR